MKKILYTTIGILTIIAITLAVSCKKDEEKNASFKNVFAQIRNTGAVALDGCDYTVVIDSTHYHPDNLTDEFKSDNLYVTVTANITADRFHCGNLANNPGLPVIHIVSIKKVQMRND